jgi:hypothetical protein
VQLYERCYDGQNGRKKKHTQIMWGINFGRQLEVPNNKYATANRIGFRLPQNNWNSPGTCWSVCAGLRCCWWLEALRLQYQEWRFLHIVDRAASCRAVVSSR